MGTRSSDFNYKVALASSDSQGSIRVWQEDGLSHVLRGHTRSVETLGFSDDGGSLLSAGDDGSVRLWRIPPFGRFWRVSDAPLFRLAKPTGLEAFQTGRERHLVVEVGRACAHWPLVCAR